MKMLSKKWSKIFITLTLVIVPLSGLFSAKYLQNHNEKHEFFKARVGCFSPIGDLLKLECTEQRMLYDVLKTLDQSRRSSSKKKLNEVVTARAKYFLEKNEYDYFSVVALMIFPIKKKAELLAKFKSIPGKRAPFTQIALDRIQGKKPFYCKSRGKFGDIPLYLKEICHIKMR